MFSIRETSYRDESNSIHDGYVKIQNSIRGHSLSSSPHSSTRMLTVLDPPTLGDLPDMKSQLDLTPFGVEVPSDTMAWFPLS